MVENKEPEEILEFGQEETPFAVLGKRTHDQADNSE